MRRRAEWRRVLDAETESWSRKSCEQLIEKLHESHNYVVVVDAKHYQVEVELLENCEEYVHMALGVDDGCFP
jgi:hypothetical protein